MGGCDAESERQRVREELRDVPPEFDHRDLAPDSLVGEVLFDGDELGLPMTVAVGGDRIFVGDATLAPAVHVLGREGGRYLGGFGRRGEGPGEFGSFPRLLPGEGEGGAPLGYDPSQARLTEIPYGPGAEGESLRVHRFPVDFTLLELVRLTDSTFVAWGLSPDSRLLTLSQDGVVGGRFGEIPAPSSLDALHVGLRHRAFRALLAASPDGRRVVAVSWRGSRIDIFTDPPHGPHAFSEGPFPFEPDVHIEETLRTNQLVWGTRNRAGYVGVAASNEGVLALFSGRLEFAFRSAMDEAEHLHVYDWDGAFLRALRLDRPVRGIACEDTRCDALVAVTWSPIPAVLRYRLPDGWGRP